MKLIFIVLICISMLFVNIISVTLTEERGRTKHLSKHKHKLQAKNKVRNVTGAATNSTNSSHGEPQIKTIPFGPKASNIENDFNSVGTKVQDSVIQTEFPFKVNRCDAIMYFPCAYINDHNDYRVRKTGFCSMTAHYTNLYADKDGQKLIQQVLHTLMPTLPREVSGAQGCLRIGGDKGQKSMMICTPSRNNARNLIQVHKDFTRCRMGDNLTEVPATQLKKLMKLCGVDKKQLMVDKKTALGHGKVHAGAITNTPKMSKAERRKMKMLAMNSKKKMKSPEFEFPKEQGNKWETDRLQYFMPNKLQVPGQQVVSPIPAGMQPGLNPINTPAPQ